MIFNEKTNKKAPEEIVRQLFLYELINKYGYPQKRIKTETSVKFGRDESKRADIVVYQNDNYTPWLVVEIKAPNKKNDLEQLKSYLNAEGSPIGIGFNGKNITRFIRPYPKEFELLADIPTDDEYQIAIKSDNPIKKIKELIANRKWTIDELNKLNEEKEYDLREIIEELEELVLANSGQDSFEEIFKLIYTKLYDENRAITSGNKTLYFRDYSDTKTTFEKISELFENAKQYWRDVFEPTDKIKLTASHLEVCINKLQEVKLFGANLRIIDEAFEFLVTEVAKGKKGQYFTPRVVIDAAVKMINPTDLENILDPACGSAGFLIHAMEYVWDKYNMNEKGRSMYADRYLWGVDFDERASKISRAIMLIAGDGKTHIFKQNTLDYFHWDNKLTGALQEHWLIENVKDPRKLKFDIVLSNPPFAGEINQKGIINLYSDLTGFRYSLSLESKNILQIFKDFAKEFELEYEKEAEKKIKDLVSELNKDKEINFEDEDDLNRAIETLANLLSEIIKEGEAEEMLLRARLKNIKIVKNSYKWNKAERHILFIQRIIDSLKEGGRAVIVLPQGIFNNTTEEYIRKYIISRARILGVVGLHVNSFKPHTGTKTSLLFIRKHKSGEQKTDYPIFFATSVLSFKDNSGRYKYVLDENGSRVTNEKGNPFFETDIYDIAKSFINFGIEQYENGDMDFDFLKDLKKKVVEFEYSVINLSQIESTLRIEAEFYNPDYLHKIEKLNNYKLISLQRVANLYSGLAYPSQMINECKTNETEIPIVKIGDVTKRVKYEDLDFVEFKDISLGQIVNNDDILMTMTGDPPDVGKCNIWYSKNEKQRLTFNQRVCKIVAKPEIIKPLQLFVFLNTEYARFHSERFAMGIRQRNVSINTIKKIQIPVFSDTLYEKLEIVIKKHFETLNKSKQFYNEAEKLLYSALGIENWETEAKEIDIEGYKYEIENTENTATLSQIANSKRLDAEYWQPKYDVLKKHLIKLEKENTIKIQQLHKLINLRKGIEVGGKKYVDNGVLFCRISNLSKNGISYSNSDKYIDIDYYKKIEKIYQPQIGDILFSKDGTAGIAYILRKNIKMIPSGGIVILSNKSKIPTEYIELILNSMIIQNTIIRKASGALIQHLKIDEIQHLNIPLLLDNEKIKKIASLVKQSFEARQKSKSLIKLSKEAVELAIEKDENTAIEFINKNLEI